MYTYITTPSTKMNVYLYIRKILHSDGTMARWHDGTIITSRIMPGMSLYVNYTCTHHSNKIIYIWELLGPVYIVLIVI